MSDESRFLELLPTIDSLTSAICRRRGFSRSDTEEFAAIVRARFVEAEYAPLRQFRGESSVATYLAVVITSWFRDYIVARDGRWRPSAAALRAGPVAVLLERRISRDGQTRDQAIAEVLAAADQPYSERELRDMVRALPSREPLRPRRVEAFDRELQAAPSMLADALVESGERDLEVARARNALDSAISTLTVEDRVLVAMRFLEGHSVADIARAMRLEQKPLYRRIERALTSLRRQLESSGISNSTVRDLVAGVE